MPDKVEVKVGSYRDLVKRKTIWKFYTYWRYWSFGITTRMNGSLWGISPYTSYRFGPFDLRKYL